MLTLSPDGVKPLDMPSSWSSSSSVDIPIGSINKLCGYFFRSKSLGVCAENAVNYLQGKDGTYDGCDFQVFREIVKRVEDSQFVASDSSQAQEKFEEMSFQEITPERKDGSLCF